MYSTVCTVCTVCMCLHALERAQTQSSFCSSNCSIVTLMFLLCVCESFIRTAEYSFSLGSNLCMYGIPPPPLSSAPWHFSNEWLILFTSESLRSVISLPASQSSKLKDHLHCPTQMDNCNKWLSLN